MFIKPLADYIEANSSLVTGTTLYIGRIPPEVQEASVIFEHSGGLNESGLKRKIIEIRTISKDYETGDTLINSLFSLFAYHNGCTFSDGSVIFNSVPLATPQFIGYDEHLKAVFMCSLAFYTS
jgi:hypothetical protein